MTHSSRIMALIREANHLAQQKSKSPAIQMLASIIRMRGHCDRAIFKKLFLQVLLIRAVGSAAGVGNPLSSACKNPDNAKYSEVAEALECVNDALGLVGYSRFECLSRPIISDDLIGNLVQCINNYEKEN